MRSLENSSNYVLKNDRWFREYVLAFTNATTVITEQYEYAEDLDGIFKGYDPQMRAYDTADMYWHYASEAGHAKTATPLQIKAESFNERLGYLENPAPEMDPTLENPRCVLNILKQHYARYTPETVASICGCTIEDFLEVANTICENSGRERTTCLVYAVGWTQHSTGMQMIRAAGILQLLLRNIGRPGGGIMAMRGHASIQGSTDVPTLYELLPVTSCSRRQFATIATCRAISSMKKSRLATTSRHSW